MAPTTKSGKRASLRARATAKANPNRTSFKQIGEAFADDLPLTTFTANGAIADNDNDDDDDGADVDDTHAFNFHHTKRDKRTVKSSVFRSRISLSAPHGEGRGISKDRNAKKHAARKKKSSTTLTNSLAALADALPSTNTATDAANGEFDEMRRKLLEGVSVSVRTTKSGNSEAAKMKTLSTKKGMVKRREKLLVSERKRFGRNMAVMLQEGSVFRGGQEKGQEVEMNDDSSNKNNGDAGNGAGAAAGLKALRGFIQERLAVQNAIS